MSNIEVVVSVKDTEIFTKCVAQLLACKEALERIATWSELSIEERVDMGSMGQQRHYRSIALEALMFLEEFAQELNCDNN